jgi:hypothetical protein
MLPESTLILLYANDLPKLEPINYSQYKTDESYMPMANGKEQFNFDKYYDYLKTESEHWIALSIKSNILLSIDEQNHYGIEAFIDKAKALGKTILNAIIAILKTIVNWIMKFAAYIANFIKTNIISKLFPKKDPNEIARMFRSYGSMKLENTLSHGEAPYSSKESSIAEKKAAYLSERRWKELFYMKYDLESYSVLERVSANTAVAVDSINKSMKLAINKKMFLRIYNAEYGNEIEERMASHEGPLSFYHERNFMHFILVLDELTKGNISSLIVDNPKNRYRLERKIKLNEDKYCGSVVAKAIICILVKVG